jgi:hypothetical protein
MVPNIVGHAGEYTDFEPDLQDYSGTGFLCVSLRPLRLLRNPIVRKRREPIESQRI